MANTELAKIAAATLAQDYERRGYRIKPAHECRHPGDFDFYLLKGGHAAFLRVEDIRERPAAEPLIVAKTELELAGLDYRGPREERGLDLLLVGINVVPRAQLEFLHHLAGQIQDGKLANLSAHYRDRVLMACYNAPIMEEAVRKKTRRLELAHAH